MNLYPKILAALLVASLASPAFAVPDKYTFDKDHTHVFFTVNHIGFSNMIGRIKEFDGYFTFDPKEPQKSDIDVTLKSASIDTDVGMLNKVLTGEKFLNVAQYPAIHFKSTGVVVTGKNTGDVTGNLTLLGVTKPVVLHVIYNKSGIHPYSNNYISGFSADAVLKRSDFGMKAYVPDVGDDVKIHMEIEGIDPFKHPGNAHAGR